MRRRETYRGGGHVKTRHRFEGRGHKPRNTWSPQKLEEARGMLP